MQKRRTPRQAAPELPVAQGQRSAKADEDKVKTAKKAKIEARKAALRAEDVAKRVFIPVSNLPKAEPKSLIASTMESIAASLHG